MRSTQSLSPNSCINVHIRGLEGWPPFWQSLNCKSKGWKDFFILVEGNLPVVIKHWFWVTVYWTWCFFTLSSGQNVWGNSAWYFCCYSKNSRLFAQPKALLVQVNFLCPRCSCLCATSIARLNPAKANSQAVSAAGTFLLLYKQHWTSA